MNPVRNPDTLFSTRLDIPKRLALAVACGVALLGAGSVSAQKLDYKTALADMQSEWGAISPNSTPTPWRSILTCSSAPSRNCAPV